MCEEQFQGYWREKAFQRSKFCISDSENNFLYRKFVVHVICVIYEEYVPGHLPAKDGYAQRSYCLTFGSKYDSFAYFMIYFGCVHNMFIFLQI